MGFCILVLSPLEPLATRTHPRGMGSVAVTIRWDTMSPFIHRHFWVLCTVDSHARSTYLLVGENVSLRPQGCCGKCFNLQQ